MTGERCAYCHTDISEVDLGDHYGHCLMVRFALDPDYTPFNNEAYRERVALRSERYALKQAAREQQRILEMSKRNSHKLHGPSVVLNTQASASYFNRYAKTKKGSK